MTGALSYAVRSPRWTITYAGVDISADISAMVLDITYTDRLGGNAGEIELHLEDHQRRWQGSWYPQEGDVVSVAIGYEGETLLPCGDFQADELELSGPPDTFYLRCLSAYITPALRTRNTIGFENQSLLQIATSIGLKYGLKIVASPNALDPTFARITQSQESDLQFLQRLAQNHNYEFSIRGDQLVFYDRKTLDSSPPVLTLGRSDVFGFVFNSRTRRIFRAAQVSYLEPSSKRLISRTVNASPAVPTGDVLKAVVRCENGQVAQLKADSAVRAANMARTTVEVDLPGSPLLSAGNNVALTGFGAYDGTYTIETARHRLSRSSGYTTQVEGRRVTPVNVSAQ
jgi:phage protein D